ncbi:type IV secretion system protein B4 [Roseinatronobacter alkalisoli]|uniref:Type IV secretion system protein B4 n=1 Tax=Roseinatronobacter alkalisoli TaxID=3028235 RepID=A0ABT5TDN4_9RHOB|nr:type IV secretion system protein B4 [Roseinatronobacter sp. HJB301]MDD7972003.1 type IV secretion system protein B4 [Roseinatronobacter sp. HJB301]
MARDLEMGIAGTQVMPAWAGDEARLAHHLPYIRLVDDHTILTRGAEYMQCIRVTGANSFTALDADLDKARATLATVIAQSGAGFSFYVHKVSARVPVDLTPVSTEGFADAVDQRWQSHLAGAGLRDRTLTITVVKRPTALERVSLWPHPRGGKPRDAQKTQMARLTEVVRFLMQSLTGMDARLLSASSGELLGFLDGLNTGLEGHTFPRGFPSTIADDVANARITFRGEKFFVSGGSHPDRVGQIFSIKTYPTQTGCTMFDDLALPIDMVVTHSFTPVNSNLMGDRIKRQIRMMRAGDDAAISLQNDLVQAADDLASQRLIFGDHHMTVATYADSEAALDTISAEIRNISASVGVKLMVESYAARASYFAQAPANASYRARRATITNLNFADMAALHRTPLGKPGTKAPWGTPITMFPTPERSAYRFSFHEKGSPGSEPTSGHTIILGRSGSGKSVLASFLMAQARRTGARIFAFDYRYGLEMGLRALGGSYQSIEPGQPTGLNPLWVETDAGGREWLTDCLVTLLESRGAQLTPQQTHALQQMVRRNAEAQDPSLRTWTEFAGQFRSVDDGGDLAERVQEWTPQGRFGWVFGTTTKDTFTLDGDVVGFDLTGILDTENETARMAVLSYIFRRIERKIEDRRPTIVLIDEAWKAFDNSYFANKLEDWLVTARKQNTVVVMMTQFASQLEKSRVGATLIQALPTQILLPNSRAKASDYGPLQLSDKELDVMLGTLPASHLALLRDDQGSHIIDADLSGLGSHLAILGGLSSGEAVVGPNYRDIPDFWRTAP